MAIGTYSTLAKAFINKLFPFLGIMVVALPTVPLKQIMVSLPSIYFWAKCITIGSWHLPPYFFTVQQMFAAEF